MKKQSKIAKSMVSSKNRSKQAHATKQLQMKPFGVVTLVGALVLPAAAQAGQFQSKFSQSKKIASSGRRMLSEGFDAFAQFLTERGCSVGSQCTVSGTLTGGTTTCTVNVQQSLGKTSTGPYVSALLTSKVESFVVDAKTGKKTSTGLMDKYVVVFILESDEPSAVVDDNHGLLESKDERKSIQLSFGGGKWSVALVDSQVKLNQTCVGTLTLGSVSGSAASSAAGEVLVERNGGGRQNSATQSTSVNHDEFSVSADSQFFEMPANAKAFLGSAEKLAARISEVNKSAWHRAGVSQEQMKGLESALAVAIGSYQHNTSYDEGASIKVPESVYIGQVEYSVELPTYPKPAAVAEESTSGDQGVGTVNYSPGFQKFELEKHRGVERNPSAIASYIVEKNQDDWVSNGNSGQLTEALKEYLTRHLRSGVPVAVPKSITISGVTYWVQLPVAGGSATPVAHAVTGVSDQDKPQWVISVDSNRTRWSLGSGKSVEQWVNSVVKDQMSSIYSTETIEVVSESVLNRVIELNQSSILIEEDAPSVNLDAPAILDLPTKVKISGIYGQGETTISLKWPGQD